MNVYENYVADINSPHPKFFPAMFFRPAPPAEVERSCIMLEMKDNDLCQTAEYALARKDPVKYLEMKADVERDVVCCPLKLEMMMHLINDDSSSQ